MNNRSGNRRRKILIVEDNEINREILDVMLGDEYDLLMAENGEEGIRLLKQYRESLSLVLLDVYMPVCNGFEFLERTQKDPFLASVPVIVATGSDAQADEEKCIRLGATDYIVKPYRPEVMCGRIRNIIRYSESLSTLSIVEYDDLTGFYTMPAFYHHVGELLAEEGDYDLVSLSVRDSGAIKQIFGDHRYHDLLCYVADELKKTCPEAYIARKGHEFYIFTAKQDRHTLSSILHDCKELNNTAPVPNPRFLVSIYPDVEKGQPVSVLCERTRNGTRERKKDGNITVAFYDAKLEQQRLQERELLMEFEPALANNEFIFLIQPKVSSLTGKIEAAEALVRWLRPDGTMISPGLFIPLLEQESLIARLDEVVFRMVCRFQKKLEDEHRRLVPVSVNLSRNSLYREDIISRYQQIAQEEQVELNMVPLEITESALLSDMKAEEVCRKFVDAGFVLHMDDFGSGYSSLASLATMPFSILKIDKSLTDQISSRKGFLIVKSTIDITQSLGMEIVAEGVETREQADIFAMLGCSCIQGYYFSKPVKTDVFEKLLDEEAPFCEKTITGPTDAVYRMMSRAELKQFLMMCGMIFKHVRVVDPATCAYSSADRHGNQLPAEDQCFAMWKRQERCENCISRKAYDNRGTYHKIETVDGKAYLIYSVCVEVDDRLCVVEMVDPVNGPVIPQL